jgi:UDP-glucose 6-dehydrogenase
MDSSRFRVVVNKSTVPVGSGNLVETLVREGIEERALRRNVNG